MMLGPPKLAFVVGLFSFPITVTNEGPTSTTVDGMLAAGAQAPTPSTGHFFPLDGETIERLSLQSPGAVFGLHTPAPDLRVAVQGSQLRGSIVTIGGKTYEVMTLKPWREGPAGDASWHEAAIQEVTR